MVDDGCEIYYEEKGKGKPLVFAPGFMGITDIWKPQFKYFSGRYRCISYDIRGCGRSDKPLPRISYGVERHFKDLKAVLSFLKVRKFVIVGHSMGGNVACLYALNHPEAVAGIVLVGSYASGKQIKETGRTIELYHELMKTKQARVKAFQDVGLSKEIS
jgi:pimeloyl-ACP methyl ester carboxylesterase